MTTYPMPSHGWTCFHCGDTFTSVNAARDHFGFDMDCDPACRIKAGAEGSLLRALRTLEAENLRLVEINHSESAQGVTALRSSVSRHGQALRIAEELGYERGLRDGRAAQ